MKQDIPETQPLSDTTSSNNNLTAEQQSKLYKPNYCHLFLFLSVAFSAATCQNYALAAANQLTDTFNDKFGWTTTSEQTWHQTLIASSNILGLTIGAVSAGKLIARGRRKTLMICCCIAITGVLIALVQDFWMIVLGRLIQGVASGIQSVATPRYIEEYVPLQMYGTVMGAFVCFINIGSLIALCSGAILPDPNDHEALKESGRWRIIFGFTLPLYIYIGTMLLFVITDDSPKFLLTERRRDECVKVVQKIYKTEGDKDKASEITDFIQSTIQKQSAKVTYSEAFCTDERFTRGSWVNIVNMINHELTGINVILAYSDTILKNILGDGTSGFDARTGTYCIAGVNALAAVGGIWTCRNIGRKTLLFWGHIGVAIAHFSVGVFTITGQNYGVLGMICFFLVCYQLTSGPVAWVYATETCCDTGLSVALQTLWGTVLVLQLSTEPLMNSALQSQGVFFMFSIFSVAAVFFVYFFMAESRGLSDRDKKALYVPGAKFGRKLRSGELQPEIPHTPVPTRTKYKAVGISDSVSMQSPSTMRRQMT